MSVRKLFGLSAALSAMMFVLSAPAMAERLPGPGEPGQPLATGQLFDDGAHGALHCQPAAELFFDPNLSPGDAAGVVVVSPQGIRLGGPRDGVCAGIYTAFTGQQP